MLHLLCNILCVYNPCSSAYMRGAFIGRPESAVSGCYVGPDLCCRKNPTHTYGASLFTTAGESIIKLFRQDFLSAVSNKTWIVKPGPSRRRLAKNWQLFLVNNFYIQVFYFSKFLLILVFILSSYVEVWGCGGRQHVG